MLQEPTITLKPNAGIRAKSEQDAQAIYRDLKAAIQNGTFAAGSRLPTERSLSNQFNAARNTVRKTMNQLASEGLIIRHVGRGTFVAENAGKAGAAGDEYELAELLEARLLFEPNLPDLVVERATPEHIAHMEEALHAMRHAVSWSEFKEAKYGLHLAIARGSRNRFIVSIFEQILASRRRAGWGRPGGHPAPVSAVRETAYRDNLEIVDALKRRDSVKAREAIEAYLLRTLSNASGD
ncbi:FadR/GntR family transcriptional regulator [Mariluticola halotolerans]|uniref:FadR/GntR family transcriptional regulator n=1 Tax=Mariluticola halotolerans TaxID=2909283 RepID=UPI0026E11F84|nr:FCD domain-containing protein [Mariluticola halotolerans]UJQ94260.1 GntR family transcriptional regulator [Mariluticola halotolerans]